MPSKRWDDSTAANLRESASCSAASTFTPNLTVYSTSSIPNFNLAAAFSVVLALATFILSFTFLKFTQRKEAQ